MTPTQAQTQTRILVQAAAKVCEDKKGEDTRILELDAIDAGLSDFFLVTSATNDRQAIAIADEIEHRLKKEFGVYPNSVEGRRQGEWILLDYVDFVVHVFLVERRAFYDIERLRKSARPLTPSEFDAELKAELTAKTRAARTRASAMASTGTSDIDAASKLVRKKLPAAGRPASAATKSALAKTVTDAKSRKVVKTRSSALKNPAVIKKPGEKRASEEPVATERAARKA